MTPPVSVQAIQRSLESLMRLSSSRRVYARQARIARVTVSQPAFVLMRRIARNGPLPMGELARLVHMDPGATARQVGHLELDGLARRYASPDDGRVNLVELTPAGDEVYQRMAEVIDGHMYGVLDGWSERDRRTLGRLLTRLVDDLRSAEYSPPPARRESA